MCVRVDGSGFIFVGIINKLHKCTPIALASKCFSAQNVTHALYLFIFRTPTANQPTNPLLPPRIPPNFPTPVFFLLFFSFFPGFIPPFFLQFSLPFSDLPKKKASLSPSSTGGQQTPKTPLQYSGFLNTNPCFRFKISCRRI